MQHTFVRYLLERGSTIRLSVADKWGYIHLRDVCGPSDDGSMELDPDEIRALRDYLNNEWKDPKETP